MCPHRVLHWISWRSTPSWQVGVLVAWLVLSAAPDGSPLAGELAGSTAERPSFLVSEYCAVCHAHSPRAAAMRDARGRAIAPYDLWRTSAMANSARDPFWRAVLAAEIAATPTLKKAVEEKCTRCHAPMAAPAPGSPEGQLLTHIGGDDEISALGRDGVSCTLCHQILDRGLGTEATFTGRFQIGTAGAIYGPHENPFPMPMMRHTGFTPTMSRHVLQSALCATCHTLDTDAVDADGTPNGHTLHEQSPYREWRNSVYSTEANHPEDRARSCQDCHMPKIDDDGNKIAARIAHNPGGRDFPFLRPRSPFGRHTFYGGNVFLIQMLKKHADTLAVPASAESLQARIDAARVMLRNQTAEMAIEDIRRDGDRLLVRLSVHNLAGHKLPTAYPSRRVWLRLEARDGEGRLLFGSGRYNEEGQLVDMDGRVLASELAGGPIQPHVTRVERADQVAIYQSVMADKSGQPTFRLLRGAKYVKDNRLLPEGWSADHSAASATAPVGTEDDDDFAGGTDVVVYALPISTRGPIEIQAALCYQVISPRFAAELLAVDTPEGKEFQQLYAASDRQPEILAEVRGR